ncbi:MAG: hypothetical protein D6746_02410, partial [Bacteroidetes bacterium]
SLWGGRSTDPDFRLTRRDEAGRRVLDDLLVGTGFGFRALLLGYPIRLDLAWPFDGRSFGPRNVYFSIGFDY